MELDRITQEKTELSGKVRERTKIAEVYYIVKLIGFGTKARASQQFDWDYY